MFVQKNQKEVWAQACLDIFYAGSCPDPLFDFFFAAKRTNKHQDEVIIFALAKSCHSVQSVECVLVFSFAAREFSSIKPVLVNRLELKLKQIS